MCWKRNETPCVWRGLGWTYWADEDVIFRELDAWYPCRRGVCCLQPLAVKHVLSPRFRRDLMMACAVQ